MPLITIALRLDPWYLLLRLTSVLYSHYGQKPANEYPAESLTTRPYVNNYCQDLHCRESCYLDKSVGSYLCKAQCADGWWGTTCQMKCPRNSIRCDKSNGGNVLCRQQWIGNKCQLLNIYANKPLSNKTGHRSRKLLQTDQEFCHDGRHYGESCDIPCPQFCDQGCHKTQSYCDHQCVRGYYGKYCNMICPEFCRGGCFQDSGNCSVSCHRGMYGDTCNMTCPSNCKNCVCNRHSGKCMEGTWAKEDESGIDTLGSDPPGTAQQCPVPVISYLFNILLSLVVIAFLTFFIKAREDFPMTFWRPRTHVQ